MEDVLDSQLPDLYPLIRIILVVTLALIAVVGIIKFQKLKKENERLKNFAFFDAVTQLASRHRFNQVIERLVQAANHARDARDRTIALILVDLDDFKPINERHGHPAGDEALAQIARKLEACVRPGDLVARLGGDEFGIIAPGADNHAAKDIALRIEHSISTMEIYLESGATVRVGISVGYISRTGPGLNAVRLIKWGDKRLGRAKDRKGTGELQVVGSERVRAPIDPSPEVKNEATG